MGRVLPEALAAAGVRATFLNHAENPLTAHELAAAIARADEVGILTVVCANSVEEGERFAALGPDVMVCELTGLIGTGRAAGEDYMRASTEAVRAVSPNTKVLRRPPASPPAGTCTTPSGAAPTPRAAPPASSRRRTRSPRWTRCSGRSTAPARTSTGGREAMTVYKDLITMDTPAGRPAIRGHHGGRAPRRRGVRRQGGHGHG